MTVRVAMLGTGFIAEFRAQVYARIEGAKLVSVLGRDPERTRAFAAKVGVGSCATSWETLLAGPDFDAVDLCLPNHLHEEFGLKAAAAGKHILCEKPLGRTAAEARRMLAAAEEAGILHAYGENMIHAPDFRELVSVVKAGTIGRPLWLRGREAHFGPHTPWFWKKELSGGGALIDMGCHLIALFNLILGALPEGVFAHTPTLRHTVPGYLIHHGSAMFWSVLFERLCGRLLDRKKPAMTLGMATAASAVACFADYQLTPKRFQPGYEAHLSRPSLAVVYGAFGVGLALGAMLTRRS